MKIFSGLQIKKWDSYTISHEPVESIALMERAAIACSIWIHENFIKTTSFKIFCGRGNNGGDGLAIARILSVKKYAVYVYILDGDSPGSPDFETNLKFLKNTKVKIALLKNEKSFPSISSEEIIIDALFGTGLHTKISGFISTLIKYINKSPATVVSVDVPSGLFIEKKSKNNSVIKATNTLTFQNPKLAFLLPENESYVGKVVVLDIGLSKEYEEKENVKFNLIDKKLIAILYTSRKAFANKGNYGYACLLSGSYGMMGAAVLSAKACLRSGVGKLTCYICKEGYNILQTSVPEAMCKVSGERFLKNVTDFEDFDVIAIGPGIGKYDSHKILLQNLFRKCKSPVVIDADALNILSENKNLYKLIPPHSIITPHSKEFERLFGKTDSDFVRINLALSKAKEFNIYIVLKGHYTFIATPEGKGFFNSTGNAGMATAGSGDVLTGIITGLLAQKYTPLNACILGVYLHGLAGDIAAENNSEEALIAGDIIDHLGSAYKKIRKNELYV